MQKKKILPSGGIFFCFGDYLCLKESVFVMEGRGSLHTQIIYVINKLKTSSSCRSPVFPIFRSTSGA